MLKIQPIATKVSGIIEMIPSAVANSVPNRMPRYAGIKSSNNPAIEIASVHHAIGVWIGVKPFVDRLSLSTM